MAIASLLGAFLFAAAAYAGALSGAAFAERITAFEDGPPESHAPVPLLICICAAIGAFVTPRAASPVQPLLIALICAALVAIWVTDTRRGIVPDAFTLGPLAIVFVVALRQHEWTLFASAAIPLVPFAVTAMLSAGRGMGWGDVKLAALGGAVLGAPLAMLAFTLACLAAVTVNFARGRKNGPIAFAPYLASAIGLAIPLASWR